MDNSSDKGFGATTTTDEVLKDVDLTGKIMMVTGASGGIGKETARALAAGGATVILAARDMEKTAEAAAEITAATGNTSIDMLNLELASQATIRLAANEFLDRYDSLHVLINNAGLMASPQLSTEDGLELQFGVCHIGHFLFTCLLAPALKKGAPSRVINLSSGGHRFSPVDLDDVNFQHREYDKWIAYGQAKTANALFSVELNQRLSPSGVSSFAVHPGMIFGTDLSRHMSDDDLAAITAMLSDGMSTKTVEQGAATSVWAAVSGELEGKGGLYLEDCSIAQMNDAPDAQNGYCSWALDPVAAAGLWVKSEELVNERFL
ncbi:MAG: SDR family NAD(P)-dependent oxidoreductase [bacterium]|nr:SDR family NAD(P)-dependent oxidoreductase [bacterium]